MLQVWLSIVYSIIVAPALILWRTTFSQKRWAAMVLRSPHEPSTARNTHTLTHSVYILCGMVCW